MISQMSTIGKARYVVKRLSTFALVAIFGVSLAAPAHARWGTGFVDTWVTVGGRTVGEGTSDDTASIHLWRGQTIAVTWTIRNLGGRPSSYRARFEGCGWGRGFRVRYLTLGGRDVTHPVTHRGLDTRLLQEGETASLVVKIAAVRRSSRTCLLSAPATTRSDAVHVSLRSD